MESPLHDELRPLVDAIARRGLVEPAIFLFEMSKPLVGCARELYTMSEPLIAPLLGAALAPALKRALCSADDTEVLITLLEQTRARGAQEVDGQRESA